MTQTGQTLLTDYCPSYSVKPKAFDDAMKFEYLKF